MKIQLFVGITLLAVACAIFVPPRHGRKQHLLGQKECTYGPAYWCQNLTNAGNCHATKHCIQTVWIHRQYPEDTTSICDTCKEMVKEARDQLESNETQELIKEVFEGSCALLHLKPIVEECDKIADQYIPDLIDTLASQMNPQTVCAVAGLCNNPRINQLLLEDVANKPTGAPPKESRCDDCKTVMDIVVNNFQNMKRDDFLQSLLKVCGEFSSFSDSCSNIVITYFQDIYLYLQQNLNAGDFCLLSGECYANFHKHEVEITPMSKIGYVPVKAAKDNDDLPCELCEQLVTHLREVLIANTTEAEFRLVLQGLCKQTKQSFQKECLSIVNQYYDMIYGYLVNELNANATCQLINICPSKAKEVGIIAPLLPFKTVEVAKKLNKEHEYIPEDDLVVKVIKPKQEILSAQEMQLPIDLLVPPHQQVYNKETCIFCQYFLHYLQTAITDPKVEDEVKDVIDKACSKLPVSVNETCIAFVNTYEPALVALIAQEIDPSQICPLIKLCPSQEEAPQVEIFMNAKSSSQCPLCLYAVTELETMIKGKKTKEEVKDCLTKVCNRLPGNLKPECTDFVNTYTDELVEMLIADFKPQEVCVYLKLCTDETPVSHESIGQEEFFGWDIETNAIYDDTVGGHPIEHLSDEKCVLCEFVMKEIDDKLKDKSTDDQIKDLVHGICNALPGTIKDSCNKFVNQYADVIIVLLEETMEPKSICTYLKMCDPQNHPFSFVKEEVTKCGICRDAADVMQKILKNPKIDQSVEHIFEKTCRGLPSDMKKTCETITGEKGIEFVALLSRDNTDANSVCESLAYCSSTSHCMHSFFKNGELDFTNVATAVSLMNDKEIVNHQITNYIECAVCKIICKITRYMCGSNFNREAVEFVLHQVCNLIAGPFRSTCEILIHQSINQIADLIIIFTDDDVVCKLVNFCPADGAIIKGIELESANVQRKFDCPICKAVVSGIKALVKSDFSQNKIKDALTKVCSKLHKFGSKCQHFVDAYAGKLVEMLTNAATRGKVCKLLKLCPAHDSLAEEEGIFVEDVEITQELTFDFEVADNTRPNDVKIGECLLCRGIVKAVKEIVKHSFTKDQVKRALSKACSKVHSNHCQSFVNKHFNQLVDLISNGSKRGKVCKLIMVCSTRVDLENNTQNELASGESFIPEPENIELGPIEVEMDNVPQITLVDFDFSNFDTVDKKKIDCTICKAVVSGIKALVKSDFSQNKIKDALTKVCSKLHKFGSKCQHFIDAYAGKLVELLTNAATRGKVCRLIKLCAVDVSDEPNGVEKGFAEDDMEHVPQITEEEAQDSEVVDNEIIIPEPNNVKIGECLLCRGIVKAVKEIVKHSFTKDQVKRALSKACSKVHSNHCQSFVNKHFNQLVDLISNGSKRGKVCKLIMVCSTGVDLENNGQNELASGESFIPEPENIELGPIEVEMDDVPQITLVDFDFSNFDTVDKKKIDCTICKAVVSGIKALVKSDFSQNKIRDALTKVCSKLHKFGSKCQHFVDAYAGKLVELLTNAATRGKVCRLIKLCAVDVTDEPNDVEKGFAEDDMEHVPQITEEEAQDSEVVDNEIIIPEPNNVKIGECLLCRGIVKAVKEIVKHSFTKDQVKRALSKACSKVHSNHCQSFVNKHFNQLVDLISNGSKRGKVCKLIMVCSSGVDLENSPLYGQSLSAQDEPDTVEIDFVEIGVDDAPLVDFEFSNFETIDKKKIDCTICKAVVSGIKALVKSDFSQNKIRDALTKVCSKLHKFGSKCQHFVDAYAGKLVELLTNAATRGKVCRLIKLCAVDVTDESSFIPESNSVEKRFAEDDMEHVPQITGEEARDSEVVDNEIIIPEPNNVKIGECLLCRGIVKAVKEIVKHSFTKDQVKWALSKACSKVHSNHCQSFVNKHFNQLVDLISNGSKRGKVCKLIMVCSSGVDLENSPLYGQSLSAQDEPDTVEIDFVEIGVDDAPLVDIEFSNFETIDKKKIDCTICKAVVSGIKALVKSDFSQNKIRDALTKVCSKLHKFGSKCQHFVDAYAGKLVELLTNAATRGKVSRLIKLCAVDLTDESSFIPESNSVEKRFAEDDMEHVPQITGEEARDSEVADNEIIIPDLNNVKIGECLLCRGIVKAVKEIVKHSFTKDQVKRALSKACSKVHSNHCQSFVNKHFMQLVDLISNGSKRGKVCKLIMVCSTEVDLENSPLYEANYESLIREPNSVEIGSVEVDSELVNFDVSNFETVDKKKFDCSICKAVVSGIKALVKSDFSQNKIKDALTKVCSKYHTFGANKCQQFVHAYSGKLVELLTNAATRGKVCKLLKLCPTHDSLAEEKEIFVDLEMGIAEDDNMGSNSQIIQGLTFDFEVADNRININDVKIGECLLCRGIVKAVKEIVKHSFTKDQVKRALSKACSKVHSNHCQSFVNKHFNQLVDLISDGSKRGKVCKLILVCSTGVDLENNAQNELANDISEPDNTEIDSFETDMENVPQITLEQLLDFFGTVDKKKIDCTICKAVVSGIKALVKSDFSQYKIKDALTKVCSKLHKFGSKCQHFVDAYAGKLVELLTNSATRGKVCRLLKLCAVDDITDEIHFIPELYSMEKGLLVEDDMESSSPITQEPTFDFDNGSITSYDECLACRFAVTGPVYIIGKDFTKDKVRHVLLGMKEICEVYKKTDFGCSRFLSLINKYLDKLVDLIANDKTRLDTCMILKWCRFRDNYGNFENFDLQQIFLDNLWHQNYYGLEKDDECLICKNIIHAILQYVRRDVTKENIQHIINAFEHICKANKEISPYCPTLLKIVEKYSNKLAGLIVNKTTRNKVCEIFKLCQKSTLEPPNVETRLSTRKDKVCNVCEIIVFTVIKLTKHDPTNKTKIEDALEIFENYCQIRNEDPACPTYLDILKNYSDKMVILIQDIKTQRKTCNILKLCPGNQMIEYPHPIEENAIDDAELESYISEDNGFEKNHDECFICRATVCGIVQIVKQDFTKDKIRHILTSLKHLCEKREKNVPDCRKYLNLLRKHYDKFVDLIADEKTRFKACSILKICPTTTEDGLLNFSDQDLQQSILVNLMEQQQSFEKDYGVSPCQPCQFAISILKSFALNTRVVALVHEQLTKLCNLMFVSPQLRNICHNQINWYWASLLNLIRTLQENQICHIVKLCNTPHEELMDYDVAKVGTSMCNICQMSLSLIKSLAQNNHFARLIHDTLNNSCNLLVSPYLISMCHSEIRTHWLTWLGTLEHFQEAQVCQTIEMCHARQIYDDNNNASDRCEACKGISHLVKFIFKIPNFKTRVHAGINKICDILPLEFGSICHAEVNINWQKWMTLLQTIPDGKLCHKVNMCP